MHLWHDIDATRVLPPSRHHCAVGAGAAHTRVSGPHSEIFCSVLQASDSIVPGRGLRTLPVCPLLLFSAIVLCCHLESYPSSDCSNRIRREGPQALLVPEVLPLGTYTWCVNNARRSKRRSARGSSELLFYDVTSSYCDSEEEIYVFNYMQPHATLNCYSPLSSLIPQYNSLITTREYALQATCWNAKPKMALEEQDKVMLNSIAESGSCISQISQSNPIAQVSCALG